MVKREIYSLNTELPGDDIIDVDYDSTQTLLDADIVLFTPHLDSPISALVNRQSRGPSADTMSQLSRQQKHWKSEIVKAASNGKLVIVFLNKPRIEVRKNIRGVVIGKINSFDSVPHLKSYPSVAGTKMKVTSAGSVIAQYWQEFSHLSSYQVEIYGDFSGVLLESALGGRIVGAIRKYRGNGAILFLPVLNFLTDEYVGEDEDEWTAKGLQVGKRFVSTIIALSNTLVANASATPPPDWTSDDQFKMSIESDIQDQVNKIDAKLTQLQTKKCELERDLACAAEPRRLLFEKGGPLEEVVLDSLRSMGYQATGFDDGESEFDAVFSSPEGKRFIGEAEGRDNKAISIDKFSQLERNLNEDLAREEVEEYAKGILFGNAYRLSAPEDRADVFTEKCLKAAKRTGYALIRTPDLFWPTRYLREHPDDKGYAEACRAAIWDTVGDVVQFPVPPVTRK